MSNPPERIWIEDEFGEGDDDQWTYGTWDVRNYVGYDVEYVRADIVQAQIDAAVLAERERCARVAEVRADYLGDAIKFGGTKTYIASLEGGALELRHIARAIRKGDQL